MGFTLIKGTFHADGYSPDGDTLRFRADDPIHWLSLRGRPVEVNGRAHASLRFEGIDALETHYGGSHQPLQLAEAARDRLLELAGIRNIVWGGRNVAASDDGTRGYILTRATDVYRRAIAFVYGGDTTEPDGADIYLDGPRLRDSFNWQLTHEGLVYPTFYTTLFHDLRAELATAVQAARGAGRGVWAHDRTTTGLTVATVADLETGGYILPKLFRRLHALLGEGRPVAELRAWLDEPERREEILILATAHTQHFDDIVAVDAATGTVRLTLAPEAVAFRPK